MDREPIFNADVVRLWSERCATYRQKTAWLWPMAILTALGPIAAVVAFGPHAFIFAFAGFAVGLLFNGLVISHYTPLLYCPRCGERPMYFVMNRYRWQRYESLLDVDYCRCCHYWLKRPS